MRGPKSRRKGANREDTKSHSESSRPSPPAFDREALLDRVLGDTGLLNEVVELFLEDAPELLSEINEAIARGDAEGVHRAAHTLKGSASYLEAKAVFNAAHRLEVMGRAGELSHAGEAYAELGRAMADLKRSLGVLVVHLLPARGDNDG